MSAVHPLQFKPPAPDGKSARLEQNKLAKRLRRQVGQAIEHYGMIEDGDRVMVGLSGGKDSWTLLDLLLQLRAAAPVSFELVAVNLDQKQPGFPEHVIPEQCRAMGVPFHVLEQDTYSVVKRVVPENKTMCGLCSRLRRGALYRYARENGFTRIALGHHQDDIIATFFLNLFHGGKLKAMPPKLLSDDGANVLIRPLAYCRESDIAAYAEHKRFPIIPCTLCGSQEHLQRKQVRRMMAEWEKQHPARIAQIFSALQNVAPSQLADPKLFDFAALGRRGSDAPSWVAPAAE
jgi:tRNA 2-thiocytidine biosynthesis protein TtcA